MRPDGLELLRRAARKLRAQGGIPVVFGGLRDERGIRVAATNGARTAKLTTIVIRPDRGLGGRSWSSGQPQAVADYARATGITHDFDHQILGEGIIGLAVAPIIVRNRIRGLIYGGYRTELGRAGVPDLLGREAGLVAQELLVHDLVEERLRALRASETRPAAGPAHPDLSRIFARLRQVAARTTDPQTAHELRELLDFQPDSGPGRQLTSRQVDVLALVALGLSNESIASSLGLSALTVKSYLRSAMARLDARTRYEAVVEARRLGILPLRIWAKSSGSRPVPQTITRRDGLAPGTRTGRRAPGGPCR
jgi:DNA-binding CsgD family transcriptional regulator